MSILDGIKDKAKELLKISEPFAVRQTQTYNAAKNRIIVAGLPLDGVVSSTLNADVITRQETGIDYYYTTYYHSIEQKTLTVTFLPTARSLDVLRDLALKQQNSRGWFNLSVHENDKIVNVYRAWIISLPEISMQQEAGDREVIFGIKSMYSGINSIDQPTDFESESYSKYGARPQDAGSNKTSTINEETGTIITPSRNVNSNQLEDFDVSGGLPLEPLPPKDEDPI